MASVRNGAIQFPPAIKAFCFVNEWTLFRVAAADEDRLDLFPVLPGNGSEMTDEEHSSLSASGQLWIPVAMRTLAGLGEQSVMMRIEGGKVAVYLRKVFETLGFRP